jgi:hypothetical protein
VPSKDIEGIAGSVPQDTETDIAAEGEEVCAECGGFGKYAESRGYDSPQSFMECGEEEQGNVISGYANAHNDGMNDGDIKLVALLINPEMLEKLKGEYGHEEYAEKLAPEVNSLAECKLEEREAQINELWGGLKNAFGKVGGDIKTGAQKVGGAVQRGAQAVGGAVQRGAQAVAGAAEKGAQAVGQYATGVKQAYHAGEVPNEVKKLTDDAMALGKQVAALNARLQKAGKKPVNVQSLLTVIKNQLGGATGAVNLSQYAAEGVTDPANVQVQPTMLKEDDEPEEEEIEKTDVELGEPEGGEVETPEEFDTPETDVDDTKDGAIGFAPAGQNLGGGVVKPEGAGVEIEITPDKTVRIEMNESERKLRKYIRERLEVKAGIRKEKLTEGKKSETLKKLDKVIDEQFKLYESTVVKKKVNEGLEEVSTGYAQQAGRVAGSKVSDLRGNDTIGAAKAGAQQTKFNAYVNPELLSYLKGQGILGAEGYGSNGIYISVPGNDGGTVYIVVGPDNYHFYSQNQDVSSIKPEMVTKLPTLIKRIQADLKGEKSKFNPAAGQQQPATEPAIAEGKFGDFIGKGVSTIANKFVQGMEGKIKKQNELKAAMSTLTPEGGDLSSWIQKTFSTQLQFDNAILKYLSRTPENMKYDILKQASEDPDGIGKLALSRSGVVYIPVIKMK